MLSLLFIKALGTVSVKVDGEALVIDGTDRVTKEEFHEGFAQVDTNLPFNTLKVTGSIYSIDGSAFEQISSISPLLYSRLFSLTSVDLGNIETLEDGLFHEYFLSITKVTFGSKIRYIGENFQGCTKLSIDIPESVERINPKLLHWINSFKLDTNNIRYTVCNESDTQYLLYANKSLIFGIANTKNPIDLKIPDCINELDSLSLTGLDIQIQSIDFNNVTVIHKNTFASSEFLGEITLSPNIEKIENGAFPRNTKVLLGDNKNFEYYDLVGLKVLKGVNDDNLIHIDPESIDTEKEYELEITNKHSLYPNIFESLKFKTLKIDCTEIPPNAFTAATINNLELGPSVRKIGNRAFYDARISGGTKIPKSIVEIGANAFEMALQQTNENTGWCELEIGTTNIESSAFQYCAGLKSITICVKDVVVGNNAFSSCIYLETVKNADGGYISRIESGGFQGCENLKVFELTDNILSISTSSLPKIPSIYNKYGMLIAGKKLIASNPEIVYQEKDITINQVEYILDSALIQYIHPDVSLTFNDVVEIGNQAFGNSKLDKLTFGSKLTKMATSKYCNFNSLIFQSDTITFTDSGFSFDEITVNNELQLPKNVIYYYYRNSFPINPNVDQTLTFNESTFEIKDKTIILSSPSYTLNSITFEEEDLKLVIKKTVRTIKHDVFSRKKFDSVTIEDGIENLFIGFLSNNAIAIPSSVKNISYAGILEDDLDLSKAQFKWQKGFLISNDQKKLCGYLIDANKDDVPAVEVFGAYSLYKYDVGGTLSNKVDFILPKGLKIIEENCLPENTIVKTNGNMLEVIESQFFVPDIEIDHFPSSVKRSSVYAIQHYKGDIEKGTQAFELKDNVWYADEAIWAPNGDPKSYRMALGIDDKTVDKLHFDYEFTSPTFENNLKAMKDSLKEVSFSDRAAQSPYNNFNFKEYEKLEKFQPTAKFDISGTAVKHSLNFSGYYQTDITTGERVFKGVNVRENTIPAGVLDIYINAPVDNFAAQKHSPWIHVPSNLGLTPADFNGMPLIYDQPDFVQPEDPGEPGDNQKPGEPKSGLTGGQIAGIVIGVLVAVALIGFAVYWFVFRKKSDGIDKSSSSSSSKNNV